MKLHRQALWLVIGYFLCANLWIVFSDNLLWTWFGATSRFAQWQRYKGQCFVLVTSVLLYGLLHLQLSRLDMYLAARRKQQASLRQAAAVFDSTQEGVLVTDAEQHIVHVNPAFSRITGYNEAEVMGQLPSLFQSGRHDAGFYQRMWHALNNRREWSGEVWNRRKNGEVFPLWQNIRAIHDEDGVLTHYVAVFSDITAIKRSEHELDYLVHHDPLTALPNRLMFTERVEHALERARIEHLGCALLLVDLDHFKHINESLGHNLGDLLLKAIGERLASALEPGITLARLGGDEFGLLLENAPNAEQAVVLSQCVLEALKAPFLLMGHELFTSASLGISLFPDDGRNVQELLRNADAALSKAKSSGREGFAFYTQELTTFALQRVELATALRHALEQEQFRVYFQPIHRLSSGRIVGFESLVRWAHPERGMVPPGEFIPVAEESGLIADIDLWVMRQACRQMLAWQAEGRELRFIAVNVSSRLFAHDELHVRVAEILEEVALEPRCLEIEITESALMEAPDRATEILTQLRLLGVRLSIDDFGTGYSSLLRLKRMPVHKLKIDQGFVAGLPDVGDDVAITQAVISLAHSMGMKVLAEGIETEVQAGFLLQHGCDFGQGFWYGRPQPAERIDWRRQPRVEPLGTGRVADPPVE